jgi:hypothetical protein
VAVTAFGIILTLACAACQGDGAAPAPSTTGGPSSSLDGDAQAAAIPEIRSEADMAVGRAFPLDAYALTDTQRSLISQAVSLLADKCLAEQGFQMPPGQASENLPQQNRLASIFGLGMLSEAQKYGYHTPPEYQETKAPPASAVEPTPDEAMLDALLGPSQDRLAEPVIQVGGGEQDSGLAYAPQSCLGRAHEKLGISLERGAELGMETGSAEVVNLNAESSGRAQADPRVVQVTKDWSDCMAASGFDWPNPNEAASMAWSDDAALEIATATADVRCKYDTNYFGVLYGATVGYQQQLIDADLAGLETLAAGNKDILDKANAVIQAG